MDNTNRDRDDVLKLYWVTITDDNGRSTEVPCDGFDAANAIEYAKRWVADSNVFTSAWIGRNGLKFKAVRA